MRCIRVGRGFVARCRIAAFGVAWGLPAAAAAAPAVAQASGGVGAWRWFVVVVLCAVAVVVAVVARRRPAGWMRASGRQSELELLGCRRLGPRWLVALVRAGGRTLVVGAGDGGVRLLADVTPTETGAEAPPRLTPEAAPQADTRDGPGELAGTVAAPWSARRREGARPETVPVPAAPDDDPLGELEAIRRRIAVYQGRAS